MYAYTHTLMYYSLFMCLFTYLFVRVLYSFVGLDATEEASPT